MPVRMSATGFPERDCLSGMGPQTLAREVHFVEREAQFGRALRLVGTRPNTLVACDRCCSVDRSRIGSFSG
jgi:hypothetical protein